MSQIDQLPKNISNLIDNVYKLKEKTFLVPPVSKIDITNSLMTKRQIAKRMILISTGALTATGSIITAEMAGAQTVVGGANATGANINTEGLNQASNDVSMATNAARMLGQFTTPESAHFIVYGKFKRDADGNLIDDEVSDPDCVLQKIAMPHGHPTFASIQVIITQVVKVLKMLGIKEQDLLDAIAQAMIAIPASIVSIASAAAILPPGAGVPVAFSAFQGLMATIMNLVTKVAEVTDNIEYLNYLPLVVKPEMLDPILVNVNATLIALNTVLGTIEAVTKMIPSVPTPPGVGNKPGNPITVEATAKPNSIVIGKPKDVLLKATGNGGSWEYNYQWSGPNRFTSNLNQVTIKGGPFETTTYSCTVTDKKDSANSATADVIVTVLST